ncbi:MAG: histidine kinase, partial [Desulfobacca sp.]|nr:histidine kinase [Desulfobacca sp.]
IHQAALEGNYAPQSEVQRFKKDGSAMTTSVSAGILRDKDGKAWGTLAIMDDITERKQNEELLTQIFKSSPMAIFILQDGSIMMTNVQFEKTMGYTEAELLGRDLISLIHPDDMEDAWLMEQKTLRDNRENSKPYEYRIITKSGEIKTFLGKLTPITFRGREALLGNLVDITDRKLMESQLVQAQKLESVGQLAAGIAHEINTPTQFISDNIHFLQGSFAGINTFIKDLEHLIKKPEIENNLKTRFETLKDECDLTYLSEEIPKALDQTREGIDRVAKIVQAMREFSHPGTKEKTMVNINRAIENTLTITRNEWKYVAEVQTEFDPALPLVSCLPEEMNQVFLNIIVNAAQALAGEGFENQQISGIIKVTTHKNDRWAEVRISDTGPGIPEAFLSRIFDPFFTTKEVGKGTGQGLAIARSIIVNKHQGLLWCESEVDKGSTFIIRLPLE